MQLRRPRRDDQRLEQLASELGYSVVYRALAKGHGGSCDPGTRVLTINDDAAINAQAESPTHFGMRRSARMFGTSGLAFCSDAA